MMGILLGSPIALFGTVLTIRANLGRSPWDVFYQGVSLHTPFTVGQISIAVSLMIILFCLIMREYPSVGMLVGAVIDGFWLDFWMENTGFLPRPENIWGSAAMILVGLVFLAIGTCFFMKQGLGSGPKDTMMFIMVTRWNLSVAVVKLVIEGGVCLIGWLLGGSVGLGTVISVVCLGYITQIVFKIGRYDMKAVKQENIVETLKNLSNLRKNAGA